MKSTSHILTNLKLSMKRSINFNPLKQVAFFVAKGILLQASLKKVIKIKRKSILLDKLIFKHQDHKKVKNKLKKLNHSTYLQTKILIKPYRKK